MQNGGCITFLLVTRRFFAHIFSPHLLQWKEIVPRMSSAVRTDGTQQIWRICRFRKQKQVKHNYDYISYCTHNARFMCDLPVYFCCASLCKTLPAFSTLLASFKMQFRRHWGYGNPRQLPSVKYTDFIHTRRCLWMRDCFSYAYCTVAKRKHLC